MALTTEQAALSPDSVWPWIDRIAGQHFIDGAWRTSRSDDTFTVVNPATREAVVEVPAGAPEDVDSAVAAARRAFESGPWAELPAAERGRLLLRFADLVEERGDDIATLETLNVGKPITVTSGRDVPAAVRYLRYFAGWANRIEGRHIPVAVPGADVVTVRQPVGVCGQIVPWNFPLTMASWKLAPALASGCTVVLKPSEYTPLSALLLAELAHEAGFPPGVVNVVVGTGPRVGAQLARHGGVDKVAFTGSTVVGRDVLRASADSNLKKVSLELGGKSPHIVFADADLERAVPAAVNAIVSNSGQSCVAGTRLLIQRSAYDEVLERVSERLSAVRVGDPFDPDTQMGPLVNQAQLDRVSGYVEIGRQEGAQVVCGGEPLRIEDFPGFYYGPTALGSATNSMRVGREEIFGPVLTVIPFDDVEDAIAIGNDTAYGLAAGVWTSSIATAQRVSRALRAGTVWVNTYALNDPAVPFGGWKESGHGREGGPEAIELYTEVKSIWTVG